MKVKEIFKKEEERKLKKPFFEFLYTYNYLITLINYIFFHLRNYNFFLNFL